MSLRPKWAARAEVVHKLHPAPLTPAQAEIVDGKIAYAAKQRDLYLTLSARAEEIRTAPEGGKRRRRKPTTAADVAAFDTHPDLPDPVSDDSEDEDEEEEPLEEGDAEDI